MPIPALDLNIEVPPIPYTDPGPRNPLSDKRVILVLPIPLVNPGILLLKLPARLPKPSGFSSPVTAKSPDFISVCR